MRCHWAATKAKDSWLLGPDEVHSLITRQQKTFDAFFCLAWRIDQASKKCRVGRLKKRRREGEWGWTGEEGKGCRSFSHVCLTALCGGTEEKWEGAGIEGSRERRGRKEGKLKTLPLCWQVLDDSSDIKVFSLTGELLCVCVCVRERLTEWVSELGV